MSKLALIVGKEHHRVSEYDIANAMHDRLRVPKNKRTKDQQSEIVLLYRALKKYNPTRFNDGGQGRCTDCGNESNRLVTKSVKTINGVKVHLIREGERLCPCCASIRGHETLTEINDQLLKRVNHG